ncbi:MFS transporter [Ideonella azotifigens]|uniref:MFS transporter n=1 Tax=Ideonella azotifigens TaxID=513160 RepID=A0ABP3VP75_9BURK|nr:MFS transporter [Ideonella azotifigens]MCD2340534.1 MFS transporter [Ideonella azotifigens]
MAATLDAGAAAPRAEHLAMAAVFFANGAGFASWVSRIPAVRDSLHLSEGQLSLALLAMGAGALLAFQLAGRGIAHLGARALTLATGFMFFYALPHPVIVGSLPALAFSLFLLGAANGAMDVAMNALAVEVETRQRKPIMSGLHGLWSAGGLCGAALGGAMAHADISPFWHLSGVAVLLALVTLLARRWLPATLPAPMPEGPRFARPEPGMLGLGAIVFCAFLIEGAMADWSAVYLTGTLGTTAAVGALGYAAFAFAMMAMRLAGDKLLLRWPAPALLRLANALGAAVLTIALAAQQLGLTMVAFVAVALGVATVAPLAFGAAARRSHRGPGHGIAAMATMGYGGFLLGPPMIGWLAHLGGLRLALLVLAALAAVISVLAPQLAEPAPQAQPA